MNHSWKHLLVLTLFIGAAIFLNVSIGSSMSKPALAPTASQQAVHAATTEPAASHILPMALHEAAPTSTPPAAAEAEGDMARLVTIQLAEGEVMLRRAEADTPSAARVGDRLNPGDELTTGPDGRALLELDEGTLMAVSENSTLTLDTLEGTSRNPVTRFLLRLGEIFAGRKGELPDGSSFEVLTPHSIAAIRGSAMRVTVTGEADPVRMACMEGHCYAGPEGGTVDVVGGQTVVTRVGGYWSLKGLYQADYEAWREAFELIERAGLELDIEPAASFYGPVRAPSGSDTFQTNTPGAAELSDGSPVGLPNEPGDGTTVTPDNGHDAASPGDDSGDTSDLGETSGVSAPGSSGETPGSDHSIDAPGDWADTPANGNPPPGQGRGINK